MPNRKHPYDPSKPASLSDEQWDWIFVTTAVLYSIATGIQILFHMSSGLSGNHRIIGVFFSTALTIASGVVYLLRVSPYAESLIEIVWNTTTAGNGIKGIHGLIDEVSGFLRKEIPEGSEFNSKTKNQDALAGYTVSSFIVGFISQISIIILLADQETLEASTNTFVKGLGADISFTIVTLIRPIFGLIFLLLRSISGSPEGFMILIGVIGVPSVFFVLLAWNVIAVVEKSGYEILQKVHNRFDDYGDSRLVAGLACLAITMIAYYLATVTLSG